MYRKCLIKDVHSKANLMLVIHRYQFLLTDADTDTNTLASKISNTDANTDTLVFTDHFLVHTACTHITTVYNLIS